MTESSTQVATHSRNRIRIFVNDQPYFAPRPVMTGQELLGLAALPAANQLFLDVPGTADDAAVGADSPIELRSGMKFYDVPVGTFG